MDKENRMDTSPKILLKMTDADWCALTFYLGGLTGLFLKEGNRAEAEKVRALYCRIQAAQTVEK